MAARAARLRTLGRRALAVALDRDAGGAVAAPKPFARELVGRSHPARAQRFTWELRARAFRAAWPMAQAVLGGAPPAQRLAGARPSGPFVAVPAKEFYHTPLSPRETADRIWPTALANGRSVADPVAIARRSPRGMPAASARVARLGAPNGILLIRRVLW